MSLKIGICKSSWTQNDAAPNLGRFLVLLAGRVHRRTPQRNGKNCNPQQEPPMLIRSPMPSTGGDA